MKKSFCPYCNYEGELIPYKKENICEECYDYFMEKEIQRDYLRDEYHEYLDNSNDEGY